MLYVFYEKTCFARVFSWHFNGACFMRFVYTCLFRVTDTQELHHTESYSGRTVSPLTKATTIKKKYKKYY